MATLLSHLSWPQVDGQVMILGGFHLLGKYYKAMNFGNT